MNSTNIRFEEGLDYGMLRSDAPEVIQDICTQSQINPDIAITHLDEAAAVIHAQIPLRLLAEGILFPANKGLRKLANTGGNSSFHLSH